MAGRCVRPRYHPRCSPSETRDPVRGWCTARRRRSTRHSAKLVELGALRHLVGGCSRPSCRSQRRARRWRRARGETARGSERGAIAEDAAANRARRGRSAGEGGVRERHGGAIGKCRKSDVGSGRCRAPINPMDSDAANRRRTASRARRRHGIGAHGERGVDRASRRAPLTDEVRARLVARPAPAPDVTPAPRLGRVSRARP